jgi:hypothetical protein
MFIPCILLYIKRKLLAKSKVKMMILQSRKVLSMATYKMVLVSAPHFIQRECFISVKERKTFTAAIIHAQYMHMVDIIWAVDIFLDKFRFIFTVHLLIIVLFVPTNALRRFFHCFLYYYDAPIRISAVILPSSGSILSEFLHRPVLWLCHYH